MGCLLPSPYAWVIAYVQPYPPLEGKNVFSFGGRVRLHLGYVGARDSVARVFSQLDAKPKPIAPRARDFSRALSNLQVIARNCDWFIALFAPVVIGRSNNFGFGFSTVVCKLLYLVLYQLGLDVITHCAFLIKLVFMSGMEYVPGPGIIKQNKGK